MKTLLIILIVFILSVTTILINGVWTNKDFEVSEGVGQSIIFNISQPSETFVNNETGNTVYVFEPVMVKYDSQMSQD